MKVFLLACIAVSFLGCASSSPSPKGEESSNSAPMAVNPVNAFVKRAPAGNGSSLTDVTGLTEYACFYEHKDYQGEYFCLTPGDRIVSLDNKSLGGRSYNDVISSIRVRGEIDVIINKHWIGDNRDNQIGVLTKSFSDLSKAHRRKENNVDWETWNDNISAIAVQKRSDVCFYDDFDYEGQEICLVPGTVIANLGDIEFNDRIKSVKFHRGGFNLEAHIGLHQNFQGEEYSFSEDIPDINTYAGGRFANGITAIGAFIDGSGPKACAMPKRN